jgi:hypothetical protein
VDSYQRFWLDPKGVDSLLLRAACGSLRFSLEIFPKCFDLSLIFRPNGTDDTTQVLSNTVQACYFLLDNRAALAFTL